MSLRPSSSRAARSPFSCFVAGAASSLLLLVLGGCGSTFSTTDGGNTGGTETGGSSSGGESSSGGDSSSGGAATGGDTSSGGSACPEGTPPEDCSPVSCDPAEITCLPIIPPEPCEFGYAYSVVNGCHGECVSIHRCDCSGDKECPDTDQYVCWNNVQRCGPYVR